MTMTIIICGPPAGGKGTQCELLVAKFDIVHLSTGDMLRTAINAGTDIGLKAKSFMDVGELVPDEVMIRIILNRLEEQDCIAKGWLLDGFPRTRIQAAAMLEHKIIPDLVIVLNVSDDEVVKRISGRRVDLQTGKTYHLTFNPPPLELQDKVVQRSDDTEETIRNRLAKYHENREAIIHAFDSTSKILSIDGTQPKDLIASQTFEAIASLESPSKKSCIVS